MNCRSIRIQFIMIFLIFSPFISNDSWGGFIEERVGFCLESLQKRCLYLNKQSVLVTSLGGVPQSRTQLNGLEAVSVKEKLKEIITLSQTQRPEVQEITENLHCNESLTVLLNKQVPQKRCLDSLPPTDIKKIRKNQNELKLKYF